MDSINQSIANSINKAETLEKKRVDQLRSDRIMTKLEEKEQHCLYLNVLESEHIIHDNGRRNSQTDEWSGALPVLSSSKLNYHSYRDFTDVGELLDDDRVISIKLDRKNFYPIILVPDIIELEYIAEKDVSIFPLIIYSKHSNFAKLVFNVSRNKASFMSSLIRSKSTYEYTVASKIYTVDVIIDDDVFAGGMSEVAAYFELE